MALAPESSNGPANAEDGVETLLNAADEAPGFGLNGRALILQAAQRAAKRQKTSHPAPQGITTTRGLTAEPDDSLSTATHEQQIAQPTSTTGIETSATAPQRDTPAGAASETVQAAVHKQLDNVQTAGRDSAVPSKATTDALIEALDPHDQPLVAFINRSSVPRILRQGVAKRLAGQQLARLLLDAGMPVTPAAARGTEAAALRKHAAEAALAQEMSIYRKGAGKQVYMNNAARQQACPSYLPAEARPAQQQGAAERIAEAPRPSSASPDIVPQSSLAPADERPVPRDSVQQQSQKSSQCCAAAAPPQIFPAQQEGSALAIADSTPGKGDGAVLADNARGDAAKGLCLEEAEIDWSGDTGLPQHELGDGDGSMAADPAQRSWSEAESEEYDPEGALLDIDSHVLSPRRRSAEQKQPGAAQDRKGRRPSADLDEQKSAAGEPTHSHAAPAVQKATLRFVKAILNPLYAAQVISRAVYKFVLLKVTTKVTQGHSSDADAAFLVAESGHIQRLVQDYIKHCQLHGIDKQ